MNTHSPLASCSPAPKACPATPPQPIGDPEVKLDLLCRRIASDILAGQLRDGSLEQGMLEAALRANLRRITDSLSARGATLHSQASQIGKLERQNVEYHRWLLEKMALVAAKDDEIATMEARWTLNLPSASPELQEKVLLAMDVPVDVLGDLKPSELQAVTDSMENLRQFVESGMESLKRRLLEQVKAVFAEEAAGTSNTQHSTPNIEEAPAEEARR